MIAGKDFYDQNQAYLQNQAQFQAGSNGLSPEQKHAVALQAAIAANQLVLKAGNNSPDVGTKIAQAYLQAYEAVEGWTKTTAPQEESQSTRPRPQVFLHPGDTVVLHNKCTGKKMSVRLSENGLAYVWEAGDVGGRVREDA